MLKNIGLFGDEGVGKTAILRRLLNRDFNEEYEATIGCEVIPFESDTAIWDFAGQEKYDALHKKNIKQLTSAILVFDITSERSYKQLEFWYNFVREKYGDIPIHIVGNKVDIEDRKVKADMISFHREKSLNYIEVSAKTGFNIEQLLLIVKN